MKRLLLRFLAVVVFLICTSTWFVQQTFKTHKRVPKLQQNRQFEIPTRQTKDSVLKTPHTFEETRNMNSYFNLERLNSYLNMNVTKATNFLSAKLTKVTILPNQDPLRVGNYFKVSIRLFYVDGKPVETGGDYLRIWLKHRTLTSTNINGLVVDHGNGSYTGFVLLPWTGHSEVIVSIANTRHQIALIMKYLEQNGTLNQMTSKFQDSSGKHEEISVCSPKPDVVLEGCNFVDRCNSTQHNYGLPWFCCKPKSEMITCDDIRTQASTEKTSLSELAIKVSKFQKHVKITNMLVNIKEGMSNLSRILSPSIACLDRDPKATWLDNSPSGYSYLREWVNLKCKPETINYKTCLKNKRVVSLGDSNSRNVYDVIVAKLNAIDLTERSNKKAPWHKLLIAKNTELNTDLMWAPHNPPFYVGPHQGLDTMRSVGNWLDRTPNDKPIIAFIHLYYHLSRTTLSVFRALVRDARAGVDRLLKRAPDSKVVIQGPHAITYVPEPLDFLRRCYEEIWFQEFSGLHDKVIYINHWDRTAGLENIDVHPAWFVSEQFLNEMLAYLCG